MSVLNNFIQFIKFSEKPKRPKFYKWSSRKPTRKLCENQLIWACLESVNFQWNSLCRTLILYTLQYTCLEQNHIVCYLWFCSIRGWFYWQKQVNVTCRVQIALTEAVSFLYFYVISQFLEGELWYNHCLNDGGIEPLSRLTFIALVTQCFKLFQKSRAFIIFSIPKCIAQFFYSKVSLYIYMTNFDFVNLNLKI